MAIWQLDVLMIALLAGVAVSVVWLVAHGVVFKARTGRLPTNEQEGAALRKGCRSVYSVIWAGFAAGCVASMIVVIELNDPFRKESVDRVVQGHALLFWGAMAVGVLIGAGGRIWSLARPARPAASHQAEDARVAE
jgi:hypothetical protein